MQIIKYVEGSKLQKGDNASAAGQMDATNVRTISGEYDKTINKGDERLQKFLDQFQYQIVPFSEVPRPDLLDANSDTSSGDKPA